MTRLKAQPIAKEYAKMYGVDYSNNSSPLGKLTSVCLFVLDAS